MSRSFDDLPIDPDADEPPHVPAPPAWQFGVTYPLPETIVNHAFTGWSGQAAVVWPKRRLSLNIAADTDYYVLYTPRGEDFFCFEPVDHPINAMNLAGGASENGMTLLGRGERLTRTLEPVARFDYMTGDRYAAPPPPKPTIPLGSETPDKPRGE